MSSFDHREKTLSSHLIRRAKSADVPQEEVEERLRINKIICVVASLGVDKDAIVDPEVNAYDLPCMLAREEGAHCRCRHTKLPFCAIHFETALN